MHQPIGSPTKMRFVRLNTGEDLVTELAYIEDKSVGNYYILFNPLKIIYTLGQKPGYLSVSLMQWVFPKICDRQEFIVYASEILTISSTSAHMEAYYYASLERLNEVKLDYGESDDVEDFDEDEIKSEDIPESDLDYVNKLLEEMKNNKKRLH